MGWLFCAWIVLSTPDPETAQGHADLDDVLGSPARIAKDRTDCELEAASRFRDFGCPQPPLLSVDSVGTNIEAFPGSAQFQIRISKQVCTVGRAGCRLRIEAN
eukprot:9706642-Alexandrium_andersonii.AAC.1